METTTQIKIAAFILSVGLLIYQILKKNITGPSLLNDIITFVIWTCVSIWAAPLLVKLLGLGDE